MFECKFHFLVASHVLQILCYNLLTVHIHRYIVIDIYWCFNVVNKLYIIPKIAIMEIVKDNQCLRFVVNRSKGEIHKNQDLLFSIVELLLFANRHIFHVDEEFFK